MRRNAFFSPGTKKPFTRRSTSLKPSHPLENLSYLVFGRALGDRKEYCFGPEDRKRLCYWTRSLFKFSVRLSTLSALLLDCACILDQLYLLVLYNSLINLLPRSELLHDSPWVFHNSVHNPLVGSSTPSVDEHHALPKAAGVNSTITLTGFISAWNGTTSKPNPTITVTQGDSITLRLSSGDGAPHQWFVDVDKNGPSPDCSGADIRSSLFST